MNCCRERASVIAVTARCVDRFLISWLIFKYAGLYAWDSQGPAACKRLEVLCRGRHPLAPHAGRGQCTPPTTCQQQLLLLLQPLGPPSQHISPAPTAVRGQALPRLWREHLPPLFLSGLGLERGDIKNLVREAAHMTRGAANVWLLISDV